MKIRVFSLILVSMLIGTSAHSQFFCPNGVRTIVNELQYTIDTETNEITFQLGCDPCTFDDGGTNCECHAECDMNYDQCYDDCIDKGGGILALVSCLDDCQIHLESCQNVCGDVIEPTKTAESFGVAFQLWWTHGLVASTKGLPDEMFVSAVLNGEPGNFVHNSTQDFEDESISFCINYQVFIQYDDGTCCDFIGSQCFHKG